MRRGRWVLVAATLVLLGGCSTTPPRPSPTSTSSTSLSSSSMADVVVDSEDELRAALADARPGAVIEVSDGTYTFKPRLEASASGTAEQPITLRGSRAAVLQSTGVTGDYGLWITGDHWRVEGLTVAHASKGVVLDGSVGTVLDGIEVFDIGDEGVHFRSCSSDGVLRNALVHDTGRDSPQYGEGVYVGSASSNWNRYRCADAEEGGDGEGDNTERVTIENSTFTDVTAEGADLKEGTDSGTLRGNAFRRVGLSGQNSADSAVDAKGNGWIIVDNTVADTDADWDDEGTRRPSAFRDGFQSHTVSEGYGTRNVFSGNMVEGAVPGFGFGLFPAAENVVRCDNRAPEAAEGLVGDGSRPVDCQG